MRRMPLILAALAMPAPLAAQGTEQPAVHPDHMGHMDHMGHNAHAAHGDGGAHGGHNGHSGHSNPAAADGATSQPMAHGEQAGHTGHSADHKDHTGHQDHQGHADQSGHTGHMQAGEGGHSGHAGHNSPMQPAHAGHKGHNVPMQPDHTDHSGHAGHDMPMPPAMPDIIGPLPQSGPPPEAFSGPAHAADLIFPESIMAPERTALLRGQGGGRNGLIALDRLEWQQGERADHYVWEANAWYGGDLTRLWLKSEGEGRWGTDMEDGALEEAELQALFSRAIGPWFDFQAGIRHDYRPDAPDTTHLAFGVQGLAPYWLEVDLAAFLSADGDLTARAEVEYDQRITQKLILQPRLELDIAAQNIPELDIASGFTHLDASIRLRYELSRQFAPYIGFTHQRALGGTADIARRAGRETSANMFVAGLRFWF